MKLRTSIIAAAISLMVSTSASAFFLPPGSGLTAGAQAEDNNLDWFIDNPNDTLGNGLGVISAGDRLVSVLEFTAINDILASNGLSPSQVLNDAADELVAVADVTVLSVAGGGTRVNLGATAGISAVRVFSGGSTTNLDIGTYTNCTTMATCIGAVTDGTLWAEFSFIDPDDEWFFLNSLGGLGLSPAGIATLGASTKVGTVNFALSVVPGTSSLEFLDQNIGACVPGLLFTCAGDGITDLVGSSDVLGGLGLPAGLGAFARTDTDVQVNVPEPETAALLGLGLLGLMFSSRRAKKQA